MPQICLSSGGSGQGPKFPLTIFETLENVSDSNDLVLGGDGVGKDAAAIKRKLSIHNGEFFLSPSREGCTLSISLQCTKRCIVAVRLLLGSTTTDYLPRQVSVMGRVIKLNQGVKRWYDLPMTNEEIVLGMRCGFVALNISSSFDSSNNALIDALEVYALPVEKLSFEMPSLSLGTLLLAPSTSMSPTNSGTKHNATRTSTEVAETASVRLLLGHEFGDKERLNLINLSLIYSAQISMSSGTPKFLDRHTLLRAIEATSLELRGERSIRPDVMSLHEKAEGEVQERKALVDEGTLRGIVLAMQTLEANTSKLSRKDLKNELRGTYMRGVVSALNKCLSGALQIATLRPTNYQKSINDGKDTEQGKEILLSLAEKIFKRLVTPEVSLMPDGVDLAAANLAELAIREVGTADAAMASNETTEISQKTSTGGSPSTRRPSFGIVRSMLLRPEAAIVDSVCSRILEICFSRENPTVKSNDDGRDAAMAQLDATSQPIAYQCDGCETFPIQK